MCGKEGNDADHAPKNDNALDQKWKCSHYPIIHTALLGGILMDNMPVNLVHKQLFKNGMNTLKRFVCTFGKNIFSVFHILDSSKRIFTISTCK